MLMWRLLVMSVRQAIKISLHGNKFRDVINLTLVARDWVLCTVSNKTAVFGDPVYAFGMEKYQDNFTK